jgi:hypothetical protein
MLATVVRCAPIRSQSAANPGAQDAGRRGCRMLRSASFGTLTIPHNVTQGAGA